MQVRGKRDDVGTTGTSAARHPAHKKAISYNNSAVRSRRRVKPGESGGIRLPVEVLAEYKAKEGGARLRWGIRAFEERHRRAQFLRIGSSEDGDGGVGLQIEKRA